MPPVVTRLRILLPPLVVISGAMAACGGDAAAPKAETVVAPAASDCADDATLPCIAVDADADASGIQDSRTVAPGEIFRVAIVALNVPETPGLGGFQATLLYETERMQAGPPQPAGGVAERIGQRTWDCTSPQPTNKLPDGHPFADTDPATSDAYIGCFNTTPNPEANGPSGTQVLATIAMAARGEGTSAITLHATQATLLGEGSPLLVDCASLEPVVQSGGCAGAEIEAED